MTDFRDAYAPPRAEPIKPTAHRPARGPRVDGGTRMLAALLESVPFAAVLLFRQLARQNGSELAAYYVDKFYFFTWMLVAVACEIAFAASPGMLLMGLRVRRADGTAATTGRLAAKAALVRVPQLPLLPATIANLLLSLVPSLAPTDLTLVGASSKALAPVAQFLWFAWVVGYLFAFGKLRQTHVDHMLGLAVYKKRDLD